MHGSDSDSALSEPLGPDTLEAKSMMPNAYKTVRESFSSGRKLVSPERNRLSDDVIEATECLKAWWDSSIIKQLA
jgi:hypothetical protein